MYDSKITAPVSLGGEHWTIPVKDIEKLVASKNTTLKFFSCKKVVHELWSFASSNVASYTSS